MSTERSATTGSEEIKTCTACGGTWPASRPHCPACGASLVHVAARSPADEPGPEEFDWRWLDALALDDDPGPQARDKDRSKRSKGAWWQFWR